MSAVDLLPCPFCGNDGSKSRLDVCSSSTRHAGWEFTVECTNCGAEGAYAASGFQAKRKWNARADLAPDPLGLVKVRALVWDGFRADPYWVEVEADGIAHLFCDYDRTDEGVEPIKGGFLTLVSLDDLKAAAQADYEARIRAALA